VFWQRTALNRHELSDDSPDQIYIALPLEQQRLGLRPPEGVIVGYRDIEPAERAWFGSVPITRVARTLEDCVALSVDFDDLERAIAVASQGGLITKGEAAALRARMASRMQEAS
jgi:predicted transcriptional regulator of viral defense system